MTSHSTTAHAPPSRGETASDGVDDRRAVLHDLRVVARAIQAHSRRVEKRCGVSAAQLWALRELQREPGMRVSALSRAVALHQSTVSNLLDKLEDKGLVRRERNGRDQRVVRLYLTGAGRDLVETAPPSTEGALAEALAHLPGEVVHDLHRGLTAMLEELAAIDTSTI